MICSMTSRMGTTWSCSPIAAAACLLLAVLCAHLPGRQAEGDSRLRLREHIEKTTGTRALAGTFRVFENRRTGEGRTIDLNIVVLPATGPDPSPDPVFMLAGGPGQAATSWVSGQAKSWMREKRDIVLVDQRGTGRSNPLHVRLPGSDGNLQGYLEPIFQPEVFEAAIGDLSQRADLTLYTTPIAMDDLDEVRAALGYDKINLVGGSYGTRAALIYLRRHPETVRCAVLYGVAPVSFINPLFHAAAAQEGLEKIFEEVEADSASRRAFPELRKKFKAILRRLEKKPVEVAISHPATGERVSVRLTRPAFAEALRVMMYYLDTNRQVPGLLLEAHEGDFEPFAQTAVESNRRIRNILSFGMLMCVTGSEDIPRIDPGSIERLTRGTFLGDERVRTQMSVAAIWPRGEVPAGYGEPVRSDVPVLLLSGTHDPVTPPRFGAAAAKHLANGLHLVVPGAHGVGGGVVERIMREFFEKASIKGLDTSGIEDMRLPPFRLPARKSKSRG
jgi:pimeloyl-ACP methyl ester carboxylesterase